MQDKTRDRLKAIILFESQGINDYQIAKRLNIPRERMVYFRKKYSKELGELKTIQIQSIENPREEAKEILKRYSPTLAQILVNIAINPANGPRERRQAAKDGLYLAGIHDEAGEMGEGLKGMRAILANIYKDCNITLNSRDNAEIVDVDAKPSQKLVK